MNRILRAQDSQTFGQMLRDERKALGKTQDDVAAAVGTRRQTIADLEGGRSMRSRSWPCAPSCRTMRLAVTGWTPP